MSSLKEKIKSNKKICGTLVSLTDPCLCEIVGNIGYDCVWIMKDQKEYAIPAGETVTLN